MQLGHKQQGFLYLGYQHHIDRHTKLTTASCQCYTTCTATEFGQHRNGFDVQLLTSS